MRDEIMRLAERVEQLATDWGCVDEADKRDAIAAELRALARTGHIEDRLGMVLEQVSPGYFDKLSEEIKTWPVIDESLADFPSLLDEAATPAPDHSAGVGGVVSDDVRTAFVKGAKWWEFKSTGATMWQSDQKLAWEAACKRYPDAALAQPADADAEGAR